MEREKVIEICDGVYWVGVKDWNRRIFDALIPLPHGTSYNSYLVKGTEKVALIDTVNQGFEEELEEKLNEIVKVENIDYLIMNHAEPDHAGAIPYIMKKNTKLQLIATEKGSKMASIYYSVPPERIKIVKDGETIDLGGKRLSFIEAPFLHWPETMFTYLEEDKILFPCDFFGAHTAFGFYDSDVEDIMSHAKRYFGEIMMPFRIMGKKALDKIKGLNIKIIAPSHGPIYRNPEKILDAYRKWTNGETREKAIVLYVSMWGSTEKMIKTVSDTLISEGIEVSLYNLALADIGDVAKDLVDTRALIFGSPTVLGSMHPVAIFGAYLLKALKPPIKYCVVLGSYGWGGGSVKEALDMLASTKVEVVGELEVNGPPTTEDYEKLRKICKDLVVKIKGDERYDGN
ncbi:MULTISPECIES: FprA family A-type flavoprotein [unclassified Thermotoga]|uniref:FprA family A-type flavoprotein n=1 Tax=unclassified Thermotoga TaxID=2631113 RepID=UPI000280E926|nr:MULTISPECIES: FprA family A-type flavoprotein [unclassified Thermotoga]AIY85666.1 flavodoxin [Thermotoga sp. 2812B]EJX26524.1 flavodoxin [Thermotoga sp. EMP]